MIIDPIAINDERGQRAFNVRAKFNERGLWVSVESTRKVPRYVPNQTFFGEDVGYFEDVSPGVDLLFEDMRLYDETDPPSLWDILMLSHNDTLLMSVIEDHLNNELGESHFMRLLSRAYRTGGQS